MPDASGAPAARGATASAAAAFAAAEPGQLPPSDAPPAEAAERGPGRRRPDEGAGAWRRSAVEAWLDRWFIPLALGILLVAAALRLPELALNPFHHDEGVNGFFETRLVRANEYAYDPANYHGPSLYYFALVSEILFGLTTEAMRLVPVFFGILTVALVFLLRRYLGTIATLSAALLLAISPGMVYVSRYFIHEMLLACFSLGLFVFTVLYLDRRRPVHLLGIAAFAALIFATKETGIITVAVFGIAAVVADRYVAYRWPGRRNQRAAEPRAQLVGGPRKVRVPGGGPTPKSIWVDGVEYRPASPTPAVGAAPGMRPPVGRAAPRVATAAADGAVFTSRVRPTRTQVAGAALLFGVIWVLLYTSFFTNMKGLSDSLATFTIWTQTGAATQIQPFTKYVQWMLAAEAPILLLGVVGGILVAARARDRLSVFIGLWALGVTLAYSIIQYKTPWIVVNMLVPLALLAGLLLRDLLASGTARQAVPLLLGASVVISGYQAIDLNYNHYDDETYPYVFVHSTRQMLTLVDDVNAAAARSGQGKNMGIVFYSPDYWPLPWYFRDYPRAGFYGQIVDTKEAVVIVRVDQEKQLSADFTAAYARQGQYTLRPGVELVLYLRRETFGL